MYNRYVPQPDGSYRRIKHPDKMPPQPHPQKVASTQQAAPCPPPPPAQACQHKQATHTHKQDTNVKDFFHNILPKDFDTGDLLIILLLLLMAADCKEDQNTALLTLALYFIM